MTKTRTQVRLAYTDGWNIRYRLGRYAQRINSFTAQKSRTAWFKGFDDAKADRINLALHLSASVEQAAHNCEVTKGRVLRLARKTK
jgi:ribosome modulation factor